MKVANKFLGGRLMEGLVSILLVVNNPNEKYLLRQLRSLNEQYYRNLELLVYDISCEEPIKTELFARQISRFDYRIIRGNSEDKNIAFEELIRVAKGNYFVFCDEKDIWEKDKVELLVRCISEENATIAYSDMSIIDDDGELRYNSLLDKKTGLIYAHGRNITKKVFFQNNIAGNAMIVRREIAKKSIPFSKGADYNQWIAIIASLHGRIGFVNKPLLKHRIIMEDEMNEKNDLNSEENYNNKVAMLETRLNDFKQVVMGLDTPIEIKEIEEFCEARAKKNVLKMIKYRELWESEEYFEVAMKFMPKTAGKLLSKILKK